MKSLRRVFALVLTFVLLFTMNGVTEEPEAVEAFVENPSGGEEIIVEEPGNEPGDAAEPEIESNLGDSSEAEIEEAPEAAPEAEIEGESENASEQGANGESGDASGREMEDEPGEAAEPDAEGAPAVMVEVDPEESSAEAAPLPELVLAPEWELDAETGAIAIPYIALPETLSFEWTFDGETSGYAVQVAPVPEGDAPEERGERIFTQEARIGLLAANYAGGGWFTLYIAAILPDGTEREAGTRFRLERREQDSESGDERVEADVAEAPEVAQEIERTVVLPENLPEDFDIEALLRSVQASGSCNHEQLYLSSNEEDVKYVSLDGSKHRRTYFQKDYELICSWCGETLQTFEVNRELSEVTEHTWVHQKYNATNNKFICQPCGKKKTVAYPCKHNKLITGESGDAFCPVCGKMVVLHPTQYYCEHENYTVLKDGSIETAYQQVDESQHLTEAYSIDYFGEEDGYIAGGEYANCNDCGSLLHIEDGEIISVGETSPGFFRQLQYARLEPHTFEGGFCTKCGAEKGIDSIELSAASVTLGVNEKLTLKASYLPAEVKNTIRYASLNPKIAKVDPSSGKIIAKKKGTTTITATADSGARAQCTVNVLPAPSKLTPNIKKITLGSGESFEFTAKLPENTASKLTAKSSNSKIASVKEIVPGRYTVTANSKTGKATITVSTFNGKKAKCTVTVKKAPATAKLNMTEATLSVGQSVKLKVELTPSSSYVNVNWRSGNESVATVKGGKVEAVGIGMSVITASVYGVPDMSCLVLVKEEPTAENAWLVPEKATIGVGEITKLRVVSDDAVGSVKSYKSANTNYATVNKSGVVKGVKKGKEVEITAKLYNGEKISTKVKVIAAPSKVSITNAPGVMTIGECYTLIPQLGKDGEECSGTVTFKSSKSKVASVDKNGVVTAKSKGSAKITVTTQNKKTATCTIKCEEEKKYGQDGRYSIYLQSIQTNKGSSEVFIYGEGVINASDATLTEILGTETGVFYGTTPDCPIKQEDNTLGLGIGNLSISVRLKKLKLGQRYYVKGYARSADEGRYYFSDVWSFIVGQVVPVNFSMAPSSILAGTSAIFTVSAPNAEKVKLLVDGVQRGSEIANNRTPIVFSLVFNDPGEHQVQFSAFVNGAWSDPCEAQTLTVLNAAKLADPVVHVEASGTTMFASWDAVVGAERYVFSLRNLTDDVLLYNHCETRGCRIDLDGLQPGLRYRLAVAAVPAEVDDVAQPELCGWEEVEFEQKVDEALVPELQTVEFTGIGGNLVEPNETVGVKWTGNKNVKAVQVTVRNPDGSVLEERTETGKQFSITSIGEQTDAGSYEVEFTALSEVPETKARSYALAANVGAVYGPVQGNQLNGSFVKSNGQHTHDWGPEFLRNGMWLRNCRLCGQDTIFTNYYLGNKKEPDPLRILSPDLQKTSTVQVGKDLRVAWSHVSGVHHYSISARYCTNGVDDEVAFLDHQNVGQAIMYTIDKKYLDRLDATFRIWVGAYRYPDETKAGSLITACTLEGINTTRSYTGEIYEDEAKVTPTGEIIESADGTMLIATIPTSLDTKLVEMYIYKDSDLGQVYAYQFLRWKDLGPVFGPEDNRGIKEVNGRRVFTFKQLLGGNGEAYAGKYTVKVNLLSNTYKQADICTVGSFTVKHEFQDGKCTICGSPNALAMREEIVNYAHTWLEYVWDAEGCPFYAIIDIDELKDKEQAKGKAKCIPEGVYIHGMPYVGYPDGENRISLESFKELMKESPDKIKKVSCYEYNEHGTLSASYGTECVGFVLQCWRVVDDEINTGAIFTPGTKNHAYRYDVGNKNDFSNAVTGDAIVRKTHVMLVVNNDIKNQKVTVIEQTNADNTYVKCECSVCNNSKETRQIKSLGTVQSTYSYETLKNRGYTFIDRLVCCMVPGEESGWYIR